MPPINNAPNSPTGSDDTYDEIANDPDYGPDFAAKLKTINTSAKYGKAVYVLDGAKNEALAGLTTLGNVLTDKAPLTAVGGALRQVFAGLQSKLTCTNQVPTDKRPKEVGFIEGLTALCDTKDDPDTKAKMIVADFDSTGLRASTGRIGLFRDLVRPATSFLTALTRTLWAEESGAYQTLATVYGTIRSVALADPILSEKLGDTEDYLYGSAKQGAETNKEHKKLKATLQTDADKNAQVTVARQVRDGLAAQISSLADELKASAPLSAGDAPPPSAPVPSASTSTAAVASAASHHATRKSPR